MMKFMLAALAVVAANVHAAQAAICSDSPPFTCRMFCILPVPSCPGSCAKRLGSCSCQFTCNAKGPSPTRFPTVRGTRFPTGFPTTRCGLGKYKAGNQCRNCARGRYSQFAGRTSAGQCRACPRGRYSSATGRAWAGQCRICPRGRYNQNTGRTRLNHCRSCPSGRTTYNANQNWNRDQRQDCRVLLATRKPTKKPTAGKVICIGDFNGDRVIGSKDLLRLLALPYFSKGGNSVTAGGMCKGDLNYDGQVSVKDVLQLLVLYGHRYSGRNCAKC